ncbi:MAG: hypothetical protein AB1499_10205, partial [Nitrospirota bacterium]
MHRYLKYATNVSGVWVSQTIVDNQEVCGAPPWIPYIYFKGISLALDTNGHAHVSFQYFPSGLYYATNESGTWNKVLVKNSSTTGKTSIAVDSNGKIHISHYTGAYNYDLAYSTNDSGTWNTLIIDSSGDTGNYSSIAVDSNNKVHISYHDRTNGYLKYATNVSGAWDITGIDYTSAYNYDNEYTETDIAVDSNNHAHISYYDQTNSKVKYVTNAAGSWAASVIDTGSAASIALDAGDKVHISYYGNWAVRYATNKTGGWVTSAIDSSYNFSVQIGALALDINDTVKAGYFTSDGLTLASNVFGSWDYNVVYPGSTYNNPPALAIDSQDHSHFCYRATNNNLIYITDTSGIWNTSTINSTDDVKYISIAADSNSKAHVSYFDDTGDNLVYASNTSGSWNRTVIDSAGNVGMYNSAAVDNNNKIHISYYDGISYNLKYGTNASGTWTTSIIDSAGDVGKYTSITVDSNNKVHISYLDDTNDTLKYATNASGSWVVSTLAADAYMSYTSIAVGPLNSIHILYQTISSKLKYLTNTSGTWVLSDIGNYFIYLNKALSIDTNGNAHIVSGTTYITDAPLHPLAGASISAGHDHTLYIKPDGTLWAWGLNDSGQLGDGTTANRPYPAQIGSDSDWKAVSAGWKHSIAIKK